jgi:hypothetical protein
MENIKIARPLTLAGILAITFVLVTIIPRLLFPAMEFQFRLFGNMPIGFLIGLRLGTGFEVSKYSYSRQTGSP